jgi:uncharacterized membrane protein YgaE (UPF0421/DUF939 family)
MLKTSDNRWIALLQALVLGAVLAAGCWMVAGPQNAWFGFVTAALVTSPPGRACLPRLLGRRPS